MCLDWRYYFVTESTGKLRKERNSNILKVYIRLSEDESLTIIPCKKSLSSFSSIVSDNDNNKLADQVLTSSSTPSSSITTCLINTMTYVLNYFTVLLYSNQYLPPYYFHFLRPHGKLFKTFHCYSKQFFPIPPTHLIWKNIPSTYIYSFLASSFTNVSKVLLLLIKCLVSVIQSFTDLWGQVV